MPRASAVCLSAQAVYQYTVEMPADRKALEDPVVLSQRLQTETKARPFDIYRTLRVVNPSPFMFFLSLGADLRLVGSSPEIMVRVEGDKVTIRPLAVFTRAGFPPVISAACVWL